MIKCNIFATKVHTGFLFTGAPPGRTSPKSQTGVLIQALEFGTFLKKAPQRQKLGLNWDFFGTIFNLGKPLCKRTYVGFSVTYRNIGSGICMNIQYILDKYQVSEKTNTSHFYIFLLSDFSSAAPEASSSPSHNISPCDFCQPACLRFSSCPLLLHPPGFLFWPMRAC